MKKKKGALNCVYLGLVLIYLYAPIAVLILMDFNASRYNSLPFTFSLEWYQALADNPELITALKNSLLLALVTAVVCMVIGTMFVLSLSAFPGKVSGLFNSVAMMPMSIPWIIIALSILLFIRFLGFGKNLFFVLMGHVVIALPYMLLVLRARIQSIDPSLEEMSSSLGASPLVTFRRITLPSLASAIIAGAFLSFMISFDNFAISYFLMPTGTSILPVVIQTSIKYGFTPEINAISTIVIGMSLACLAVVACIMKSSIKSMFGRK